MGWDALIYDTILRVEKLLREILTEVRSRADKQIWRIEGNPCDMQYRRSDCPLIAVGGLG